MITGGSAVIRGRYVLVRAPSCGGHGNGPPITLLLRGWPPALTPAFSHALRDRPTSWGFLLHSRSKTTVIESKQLITLLPALRLHSQALSNYCVRICPSCPLRSFS